MLDLFLNKESFLFPVVLTSCKFCYFGCPILQGLPNAITDQKTILPKLKNAKYLKGPNFSRRLTLNFPGEFDCNPEIQENGI